MLFVSPLHALSGSVPAFAATSVYAVPSTSAPVLRAIAQGASVSVTGYRFSTVAVASSDRGGGAGAGPDNVWWEVTGGGYAPDAALNTTGLTGAPLGAAVSTLPAGLRSFFVTVDDPVPSPTPAPQPDDDSAFLTKAALKTAIGSL